VATRGRSIARDIELLADRRLFAESGNRKAEKLTKQGYGIWDIGYRERIKIKIKIKEMFQATAEKIKGGIAIPKTKHRMIYESGV